MYFLMLMSPVKTRVYGSLSKAIDRQNGTFESEVVLRFLCLVTHPVRNKCKA